MSAIDRMMDKIGEAQGRAPASDAFLDEDELDSLPDPEWLIQDWLPRDALVMLYGHPGTGKSFVALDWVMSVAAGLGSWMGNPIARPGPAIYVVAEGVNGMKLRRRAWRVAKRVDGRVPVTFRRGAVNFVAQAGADWLALVERVKVVQPSIVVIDTLARCAAGGDENSSMHMGKFVDGMDLIRQVAGGATVVVVHHSSKDGQGFRGSSALSGAMDTMIRVDKQMLRITKQKDADEAPPIRVWLRGVDGTHSAVLTRAAA